MKRKESRADFQIKQRDDYIQHLKEQLSLRDKIIKDEFGVSITNFLPGGKSKQRPPSPKTMETEESLPMNATIYQTQTLEQTEP